ncbi:MAG: hypothetical protein ACRBB0_27160 [Pelagimonas sp.]|uniref:hypothetical protein n=1 Tax=Pelagimonas sp. TaxID=2073170 RepID=UPI003D6AC76D
MLNFEDGRSVGRVVSVIGFVELGIGLLFTGYAAIELESWFYVMVGFSVAAGGVLWMALASILGAVISTAEGVQRLVKAQDDRERQMIGAVVDVVDGVDILAAKNGWFRVGGKTFSGMEAARIHARQAARSQAAD